MQHPAATVEELTDLAVMMGSTTSRLDPDVIVDGEVDAVVTALSRCKRLIDGALTVMARRVTESRCHAATGNRSAEEYLAKMTGTSTGRAKDQLSASTKIVGQPDTRAAVTDGELSADQAVVIADAVATDPTAAGSLLDSARDDSLVDLRKKARKVKFDADPDPARTRTRHHHRRGFHCWTESDGEWRASLSGPADAGARIEAALRGAHDRIFKAAHASGRREAAACYLFDPLVATLEHGAYRPPSRTPTSAGTAETPRAADPAVPTEPKTPSGSRTTTPASGPVENHQAAVTSPSADAHRGDPAASPPTPDSPGSPRDGPCSHTEPEVDAAWRPYLPGVAGLATGRQTKVIIHVDGAALVRGRLQNGDRCWIQGIGDVPLAVATEQIASAHLAYVIRDGVDVRSVVHLGRQATAHQRTALQARGHHCEVPGCGSDHLLEIDHITGWAFNHQTALNDLAWLCPHHHRKKSAGTHRLTGPPGNRKWLTDLDVILSEDRPTDHAPARQPALL